MAASVWSGYLTFGLISMPVRLFSGARSSGISFNMLHRPDLQRVKQQYYCPADNRVVERSEIVKGYEFRKDEYVVVEPEEIKKIEPRTAKTMEILEFVKASEVDPVYFESSYYMIPDEAGRRPYALLTKALEESDYVRRHADPSDARPLAQICKEAGAGKRTVERLFQEEVGMTFGKWRQQLRLMQAMRLLAEGAKVTHAALEAGYSTPSAFISMFRKALGTTPTLYFRAAAKTK